MPYGCHNRAPYVASFQAQDGWYDSGPRRKVEIPFRMSQQCEYRKTELGEADKNCAGCGWRTNPTTTKDPK